MLFNHPIDLTELEVGIKKAQWGRAEKNKQIKTFPIRRALFKEPFCLLLVSNVTKAISP